MEINVIVMCRRLLDIIIIAGVASPGTCAEHVAYSCYVGVATEGRTRSNVNLGEPSFACFRLNIIIKRHFDVFIKQFCYIISVDIHINKKFLINHCAIISWLFYT